jgi:hypothetical protein
MCGLGLQLKLRLSLQNVRPDDRMPPSNLKQMYKLSLLRKSSRDQREAENREGAKAKRRHFKEILW